MKHPFLSLLGVALPLAITAIPTHADSVPDSPSDKGSIGVQVGFAQPSSGDARDKAGSGFTAGVNYMLAKQPKADVRLRFDLDYTDFSKSGNKVQPITFLANAIKPFGADADKGPYVGAGLGVVHTKVKAGSAPFGSLAAGDSQSKSTLAGQALVGYNFSQHLFAEGAYHLNERTAGVNSSYWGISIGTRF